MRAYQEFKKPNLPEGYSDSYILKYPRILNSIAIFLYFLFYIVSYILIKMVTHTFFPTIAGPELFWIIFFAIPITDLFYAVIQREVSRWLGYHVSFHITQFFFQQNVYTIGPGQFQKRGHALLIAVTPLLFFVVLGGILGIIIQGDAGNIITLLLSLYMVRSIFNIYYIYRLVRMSKGTLLYATNSEEKQVFEPIRV